MIFFYWQTYRCYTNPESSATSGIILSGLPSCVNGGSSFISDSFESTSFSGCFDTYFCAFDKIFVFLVKWFQMQSAIFLIHYALLDTVDIARGAEFQAFLLLLAWKIWYISYRALAYVDVVPGATVPRGRLLGMDSWFWWRALPGVERFIHEWCLGGSFLMARALRTPSSTGPDKEIGPAPEPAGNEISRTAPARNYCVKYKSVLNGKSAIHVQR